MSTKDSHPSLSIAEFSFKATGYHYDLYKGELLHLLSDGDGMLSACDSAVKYVKDHDSDDGIDIYFGVRQVSWWDWLFTQLCYPLQEIGHYGLVSVLEDAVEALEPWAEKLKSRLAETYEHKCLVEGKRRIRAEHREATKHIYKEYWEELKRCLSPAQESAVYRKYDPLFRPHNERLYEDEAILSRPMIAKRLELDKVICEGIIAKGDVLPDWLTEVIPALREFYMSESYIYLDYINNQ